jgi:prolipoprotein diacylglyceryltransferase
MNSLQRTGKILATLFSIVFALLLLTEIVGAYSFVKSAALVLSGVGAIWAVYFLLGGLFRFIYVEGLREQAAGKHDSEQR